MRRLFLKSSCAAWILLLAAGGGVATSLAASDFFYPTRGWKAGSIPVHETLLQPWINGFPAGDPIFLIQKEGKLFVDPEDLKRWRFRVDTYPLFSYLGRSTLSLDAIEGLSYRIDPKEMKLLIDAKPRVFLSSLLESHRGTDVYAADSVPGAFFNYDLLVQHEGPHTATNGLGEIGVFGSGGLWLGDFLYRSGSNDSDLIRLETSYRKDYPQSLQTFKLGDGITRNASLWGGAVRFGGIQWGTNFQTQPHLVTTPFLSFGGEAVLPSTVDLYINDVLQMHSTVLPGPFAINHVTDVSGEGEARVVVADLLGREQIISGAFYASPKLLRAGLEDYSFEAGFVRENFAIRSNDYGRSLATGTYRKGITDTLTAELHGEFTADDQTAGISGVWLRDGVGVFSTAAALSNRAGQWGSLGMIGFERSTSRLSFGGSLKIASEEFIQIGSIQPLPRLEENFYAGYALPSLGFFSANFTQRDYRSGDDIAFFGVGYHYSWREIGSLQLSAFRTIAPNSETSFLVYFSRAFGDRQSGSLGYSEDSGGSYETARFKKSLPTGPGNGYALAANFGKHERAEAMYELQTDYGTYGAGVSHTDYTDTLRASARGGIATMDGKWFLSRRIDQSFAVVDTGDYSGVVIYKDNRYAGRSGKDGKMLVPNLRAFEKNPIRIEEADLPLDVSLPYLEYEAVPSTRSGVFVSFPLKKIRRAVVTVVLEEGGYPPSGAAVHIAGEEEKSPVGRKGRIYLEGLQERSDISLSWVGHSCGFTVDYPQTDDPMPDLGTYTCKGEKR